jgi:hypothetical protein
VPEDPASVPAGTWSLTALITDGAGNVLSSTNSVPIPIAARILLAPTPPAVINSATETTVTLQCDPPVQPSQTVSLIMAGTTAPAQPTATASATLTFQFSPPLAAGSYIARLQVDGVTGPVSYTDSPPPPPAFTGPTVVVP